MKGFIVLLRHGIAEDRTPDTSDEERRLTETGKRRMKQIARTLALIFPEAEALYSSPLVRAVETSQAVEKAYGGELKMQTTDALKPGTDAGEFRKLLANIKSEFAIFVGHEPILTEIMLDLTAMRSGSQIELKKGGCYGIRLDDGSAHLEWMLPPRVLRLRE
jgi:phosphohistidine phosphatase